MGCWIYRTEIMELVERNYCREDAIKVNSHIIGLADDLERSRVELEAKDKRIAMLEEAIRIIPDWGDEESDTVMRHAIECAKAYGLPNNKGEG
jgi:hypothetical protein